MYKRVFSDPLMLAFVVSSVSLLAAAANANAADLVAGNAEASVSDSDGNVTVFRVDGGDDNVFLANYFFRTDSVTSSNGGEVKIDALGPVSVSSPTANRVILHSVGNDLEVQQEVILTGASSGSGTATLFSTFAMTNLSSAPVDLDLFYAGDFDLNFDQGNPDDQTTVLDPTSVRIGDDLAELVVQAAPASDSYEVYDGQFDVLFNFNSDVDGATTLNNTPAVGDTVIDSPGMTDAGFAFGWNRALAPGETFSTFTVSNYTVIPEPSSLALFAGLAAFALRRRR